MEFSFDRSNESSNLRNANRPSESAVPPVNQEQSQAAPHSDGVDTTTITNERLRKAIEKNRARQAERNRVQGQASFLDKQQQQAEEVASGPIPQTPPPPRPRAEERVHDTTTKPSQIVTRRTVARADEAEFAPIKRAPKKVASQISYSTSTRKKSKPMNPALVGYLVKGSWIFCGIMILRLIFANGGVTDFYSQRSLYNDRLTELERIKKENMQLVHEIERMQTDGAYQKKLVRDNLGFIASDEFLVLFPKENSVQ